MQTEATQRQQPHQTKVQKRTRLAQQGIVHCGIWFACSEASDPTKRQVGSCSGHTPTHPTRLQKPTSVTLRHHQPLTKFLQSVRDAPDSPPCTATTMMTAVGATARVRARAREAATHATTATGATATESMETNESQATSLCSDSVRLIETTAMHADPEMATCAGPSVDVSVDATMESGCDCDCSHHHQRQQHRHQHHQQHHLQRHLQQQHQQTHNDDRHRDKRKRSSYHNSPGQVHDLFAIMQRALFILSLLFVRAASTPASIAAVNPESLRRAAETLDNFMQEPVQALDIWQHYRLLGGFEDAAATTKPTSNTNGNNTSTSKPSYGLPPSKRDEILRYQFSFALAKQFKMYYGDEDGTFLAYDDFFVDASYREPRDSGYDINDPTMQHYYNSCVDIVTGAPTTCDMQEGSFYINCIDNCTYVPCDQINNEPHTTNTNANTNTNDTSSLSPKAWCKSYEKRTANEQDARTKGFVPRTYSCIDRNGQFTEQDGETIQLSTFVSQQQQQQQEGSSLMDGMQNAFTYTVPRSFTLGDCTFRDGTKVRRSSEEGQYHYCGTDGNGVAGLDGQNTNNNCANTFIGGFRSRDYDPRVRGWYEQVRNSQQPSWSNPYTFFTTLEMGITYGQPMYVLDHANGNENNGEARAVFQGVLAVDYPLSGVSGFLRELYGLMDTSSGVDTDGGATAMNGDTSTLPSSTSTSSATTNPLLVAIAEDAAPHYLIGISTSRKTAQTVQKKDPTKPCPADAGPDQCSDVRVSMLDETDALGQPLSDADDVLRRAFQAQAEANFDESLLVPVPSGSATVQHVCQSLVYEQDNASNLKWQIVVVFEVTNSEADSLEIGNPLMIIVIALGSLGFLLCMAMWIQFYNWRTEKAIVHADWRFTLAFLMGCALMNLASFTALGPNTDENCMLRMWSFNSLFAVALAPLLIKVWRMYSLIGKSSGFTRRAISNTLAAMYTLPIIGAQLVFLLLFAILDPPRQVVSLEADGLDIVQHITCEQDSDAFIYIQFGIGAFLVLIGCVLAYLTRNLDSNFGEAKQLIFAMYNVAFTGIVIVIIAALVDIDQSGQLTVKVIGIFWGTLFSSSAFVVPRLLQVKESRQSSVSGRRGPMSSFRNVHVSGIDLQGVSNNNMVRRSTFGSSSGNNSGSNLFRRSLDALRLAPKLQQELSNLEEEGSQISGLEDASNSQRRSILNSSRHSQREKSMRIDQIFSTDAIPTNKDVFGISHSHDNEAQDESLSQSEEDYDEGGPQWDGGEDLNQELNRSCRWSSQEASSSSFSVGLEGPRVHRFSKEGSTLAFSVGQPQPGSRSRSRMRSIETQIRNVHSQMESINEEVPPTEEDSDVPPVDGNNTHDVGNNVNANDDANADDNDSAGRQRGGRSDNDCDDEYHSGDASTETTVPNSSDYA